jgi:hypothetical protein
MTIKHINLEMLCKKIPVQLLDAYFFNNGSRKKKLNEKKNLSMDSTISNKRVAALRHVNFNITF